MNKPTLVTGACGFVGRNMVLKLLKQGKEVWGVDSLIGGKPVKEWLPSEYAKKFKFFKNLP